VHTKNLLVNEGAHRQILKSLTEFFPYFQTVLFEGALAGVLESVNLVDKAALVVASKHIYKAWVA
jgi:hypothetical protein